MRWHGLALRRLRDDRLPAVALALLVLATSAAAALAPRTLVAFSTAAVRAEVSAAPAVDRSLQLLEQRILGPGTPADPLGGIVAEGAALDDTIPASIRGLVTSSDVVVESGRFRVGKRTPDPSFIRFRIQQGVADHVRWLAGRPPTGSVTTLESTDAKQPGPVPVYEGAVSAETAKAFGIAVGETVPLTGDASDTLVGRVGRTPAAFVLVTGTYEVTDPGADYWLGDEQPAHPVIRSLGGDSKLLDAAVLVAEATYPRLASETMATGHVLRYTWRRFLAVDRIEAGNIATLSLDARRFAVAYPLANVSRAAETGMRTGILRLFEGFEARWTAAQSVIAVTAVGPGALALATLALVAALSATRRRVTLAVVRSRGATGPGVLLAAALEAVAVGLPAAAVGLVVAILIEPAGGWAPSLAAAGAVLVGTVFAVTLTVTRVARGQGTEARPGARRRQGTGARRVVLDALVVIGAATAAYLLRERGARPVGGTGALVAFDPLLAAVPVLAGIAAGLLLLRLYPLPLRAAAAIGRRGRGLVTLLAARRAVEGGSTGIVLLVLFATATVGTFAGTTLDGLDRGAESAAWQAVGGAYRFEAPNGDVPAALDAATLPGVTAAAGEFRATVPLDISGPPILFDAVDAASLEAVLAGTPAAPSFPAGFTTPGTGPIPALVSTSLVGIPRGVKLGDTFSLSVEGYTLVYRAVGARDAFPGLPAKRDFVVAAREWFRSQAPTSRIAPVVTVARGSPDIAAALREAVRARAATVTVASQAEDASARRAAPVTGAVRSAVVAAALLALAYAVLGTAAALALAVAARAEETAQLRTLGLSLRQGDRLALAEHGPAALTALAAGAVLGLGLFLLLGDALGVAALVGSDVPLAVSVDPGVALLLAAGMAGVVGAGLAFGALLGRRVAPVTAVRGRYE